MGAALILSFVFASHLFLFALAEGSEIPCAEDFSDIASLTTRGWDILNSSQPLGTTAWYQGDPNIFPAQDGANDSYALADLNATIGTPSLISTWLITPPINFGPNQLSAKSFAFYTRARAGTAERLVIRTCAVHNGERCEAPTDGFGGFTTVLLDINPGMIDGVYPLAWTQFEITPADSLPIAGSSRVALHHYLSSQPSGSHGSHIGVDSIHIFGTTGCAFSEYVFLNGFD